MRLNRIRAIEVAGFRAFAHNLRFDVDASAVILVGPNGAGKTSLYDAVMWGLTGLLPRLGSNDKDLVSLYSDSGVARVALDISTDRGESCHVVRTFDGADQKLLLQCNGTEERGAEAAATLIRGLWPAAASVTAQPETLALAVTRSVYLQQDLVREFVEADDDKARFSAVSELVGSGRVTELQLQLEREKKAWTQTTNQQEREGSGVLRRLQALKSQLAQLSREDAPSHLEFNKRWESWWKKIESVQIDVGEFPAPDSADSVARLDRTIKQIQARQLAAARRCDSVKNLLDEMRRAPVKPPEVSDSLVVRIKELEERIAESRKRLIEAQKRTAEERRAQVVEREQAEELKALAQLALRHLQERCPVCTQDYDHNVAEAHLRQLLGVSATDQLNDGPRVVDELTKTLESHERELSDARETLRVAERAAAAHRDWLVEQDRRTKELQVETSSDVPVAESLSAAVDHLTVLGEELAAHHQEGDQLGLSLARSGERARRAELEREIESIQKQNTQLEIQTRSRQDTGEFVAQILDYLREASSEVVGLKLKKLEPLLQRIYGTMDPHPSLTAVGFLTRILRGRGHLAATLVDPEKNIVVSTPELVLSSSQMNALAVSIFLSFNLGLGALPIRTVLIDDPIQSLDDINLLGLLDLLRRLKSQRQLFVSTHDSRFGQLLQRKLRPSSTNERTVAIRFEGWERRGPRVSQFEISADNAPLRLVG